MTKIILWQRTCLTRWHNLLRSLAGIIQFSTLILFSVFTTGKGYSYSEEYSAQLNEGYRTQPAYYSQEYSPPPQYEQYEQYAAVTYQELNTSYHCGVIPDTNFELYRSNSDPYEVAEVAPFGKFPWTVLILSYNKVICQGTLIHYNLILTSGYCIPEYKSLENYEIRVGDWDLLTDYNEYEAYADRELRICSRHPLTSYTPKPSYYGGGYGYNYYKDDSSDLVLIKSDYDPSDKFPHVKPICLPKTYAAPSYYGKGQNQYAPYAVCWVAGWYGSEITSLRNHPGPNKVTEYEYGGYSSYSQGTSYYQKYYKGYDSSMIQKRAKVKQVACPSTYGNSYGYSSSSSVCFVGVDGYDACVADQGAAVFCVVEEGQSYGEYNSGYNNQDSYSYSAPKYEPVDASYDLPVMSSLHPDYDYEKTKYNSKAPIKVAPSPSKPGRYRAVLYAVVQKPAKCSIGYYGNTYYKKSRPLVATLVDYDAVSGIMDLFWTHGYDKACPVTKAKYRAPVRSYYGPRKSYKNAYYFGSYYNAPRSSYGYNRNPTPYNNY